ncbi:MAG: Plug domain-containing protein, partial [Gammaproteobacteria bacterium]
MNWKLWLIASGISAAACVPAQAQTTTPPPAPTESAGSATTSTPPSERDTAHGLELEEVIVEARRHLENLQNVPISITALSAQDLSNYHLGMSAELQNYIPNLTINGAFGSTNPQIFIRGVGNNDYNDNAGSTVGVYLDSVFLNAPAGKLLQMFDLESAQVLRGPQGTLFGKNNTAGAIL